jgi:hypothetical protein
MGKPQDAHRASAESAPSEPFRWPPRDQLPPGITVKPIPVIGTTWYERGAAYWLRRAWMALLFAIADALVVVIVFAFADAAGNGRRTGGFWAVIAVELVLLAAGYTWMALSSRRASQRKQQQGPDSGRITKFRKTDDRGRTFSSRSRVIASYVTFILVAIGLFVRPLRAVILGVIFFGACAGFGIAIFVTTRAFGREFGPEPEARAALEAELRHHSRMSARPRRS